MDSQTDGHMEKAKQMCLFIPAQKKWGRGHKLWKHNYIMYRFNVRLEVEYLTNFVLQIYIDKTEQH